MAAEEQTRLQIGHVLFIDIVGYFKLLITDQSDQLQTLKQIVRGTEQFRIAEAAGNYSVCPPEMAVARAVGESASDAKANTTRRQPCRNRRVVSPLRMNMWKCEEC